MTQNIIAAYRQAKKRLLLLDYDGTLVDFRPLPPQAKPGSRLLGILDRLAQDVQNTVVIISGRDKETLDKWLGHLPVALVAEHGQFSKLPYQPWQAISSVSEKWKSDVRQIMEQSVQTVLDSFVEEKTTSLVWHNRPSDPKIAQTETPELLKRLRPAARAHKLTILTGKRNVEARAGDFSKGTAGNLWLQKQPWDFMLAAGDDMTDEDLFAVMPAEAYTLKIGQGATAAKDHLASPQTLVKLLSALTN